MAPSPGPAVEPAPGTPYWLTTSSAEPSPPLEGQVAVDVAIVGGGFTGLWTALALLQTDPALRVAVLEMETVGFGASGRNGGFCSASLTHGLANGIRHFPDELAILEREGLDNLADLVAFIKAERIEAELDETGTLDVATEPWQVDDLHGYAELAGSHGSPMEVLDRAAV